MAELIKNIKSIDNLFEVKVKGLSEKIKMTTDLINQYVEKINKNMFLKTKTLRTVKTWKHDS